MTYHEPMSFQPEQLPKVFDGSYNGTSMEQLCIPPSAGNGSIRILQIEPGISAIITDGKFNSHLKAPAYQLQPGSVVLRFHYDVVLEASDRVMESMLLFQPLIHTYGLAVAAGEESFIKLDTSIGKAIYIVMSSNWLYTQLGVTIMDEALQRFSSIAAGQPHLQYLGLSFKEQLRGIFEQHNAPGASPNLRVQLVKLSHSLIQWIGEKYSNGNSSHLPAKEDVENVQIAEIFLLSNLSNKTSLMEDMELKCGFAISQIARQFELLHGMNIESFYLYHRLQTAKDMLGSARFSIEDTAKLTGFQHSGEFAVAYIKQFGSRPKVSAAKLV
jgi:AraC-like DNA-binding protein